MSFVSAGLEKNTINSVCVFDTSEINLFLGGILLLVFFCFPLFLFLLFFSPVLETHGRH